MPATLDAHVDMRVAELLQLRNMGDTQYVGSVSQRQLGESKIEDRGMRMAAYNLMMRQTLHRTSPLPWIHARPVAHDDKAVGPFARSIGFPASYCVNLWRVI